MIDNTVTPPPLFNPFEHGADIAVYSLTKMIGGHGTSIGGAIVEKGDFDWKAAGKYPEITEPDLAYHGVNFWDAFGNHDKAVAPGLAYVLKIRTGLLRDLGAGPLAVQRLAVHPGPGDAAFAGPRAHARTHRRLPSSCRGTALVCVGRLRRTAEHPDYRAGPEVPAAGAGRDVQLRHQGRPGGGQEVHRLGEAGLAPGQRPRCQDPGDPPRHAPPTQQLTPEEQAAAGVTPDLVRVSVALEDVDDIIADLDQALKASQEAS